MKDLKTYLSESCSGKKYKSRKFNKKVFDLIRSGKYKFHDKGLKDVLDKASANMKENFSEDEIEDYVEQLRDWVSSSIDDWMSCWDGEDDMQRDLDCAQDEFDNRWDDFVDSLELEPDDEHTQADIDKLIDELYSQLGDLVDNYVAETEEYYRDHYLD